LLEDPDDLGLGESTLAHGALREGSTPRTKVRVDRIPGAASAALAHADPRGARGGRHLSRDVISRAVRGRQVSRGCAWATKLRPVLGRCSYAHVRSMPAKPSRAS
jgi:hypothetical protein